MDLHSDQHSLVPNLPAGALVLRSFGKAYGLAGVRLGFALGSPEDCARLRAALGPWAVSGPAIEIGQRALADEPWLVRTRARLRAGCATGWTVCCSRPDLPSWAARRCSAWLATTHAACWFEALCTAGILTRPFREQAEWLRFGLPHGPEAWTRLEAALVTAVASGGSCAIGQ